MRGIAFAAILAGLAPVAASAVTIGGIEFQDTAFADALTASSGGYTTSGGTLADVLTDADPGSFAFSRDAGAFVELAFVDNVIVNGMGDDLALFELGVPDTWIVTINGISRNYTSIDTGEEAGGSPLTRATIDLADFGIIANETVNRIRLAFVANLEQGTVASTSLAAAINTDAPVPEPATWALMIAGFGLVGAALRRRARAFG